MGSFFYTRCTNLLFLCTHKVMWVSRSLYHSMHNGCCCCCCNCNGNKTGNIPSIILTWICRYFCNLLCERIRIKWILSVDDTGCVSLVGHSNLAHYRHRHRHTQHKMVIYIRKNCMKRKKWQITALNLALTCLKYDNTPRLNTLTRSSKARKNTLTYYIIILTSITNNSSSSSGATVTTQRL